MQAPRLSSIGRLGSMLRRFGQVGSSSRARVLAPVMALAIGVGLMASPHSALADQVDPRNFTFVNDSGYTVTNLYVSASYRTIWEEDLLGSSVLPAGRSINVRFAPSDRDSGNCRYDVKVVRSGGAASVLSSVNLCTTSRVTYS